MSVINFPDTIVDLSTNLRPYAINLTKDIDDAHDLLQETVYRALINRDKYSEGTNLKAWLFTIMKNIFINSYRRRAKRNTIINTTDNLYLLNVPNEITYNRAEGGFIMQDLYGAINSLSDDYKVPFMMHHNGYKYQEIADDLHLPLGTVKSRIFFARKELKRQLSNIGYASSN
jgi:RNA polymerase sigma-70 factor (ECF subfamily)